MTSITFFPPFPDRLTLTSHLYRAVWALLPCSDHIDELVLPYDGPDRALLDADQLCRFAQAFLPKDFDPAISELASRYTGKIQFDASSPPTAIVLWDASDPAVMSQAEQLAQETGATVVNSDPIASERDLIDLILLAFDLEPEHVGLRRTGEHFARFTRLARSLSGQSTHLFATGPSVQGVLENPPVLEGTVAFCNALISDQAAVAALDPNLLIAGDPVQHNGPSRTAGAFRAQLADALITETRSAVVPLGFLPYLEATLPSEVVERVIGIPTAAVPGFNLDLAAQFATATTANVMTMLMLPVALTFSRDVTVYGCDGKPDAADTQPWSHRSEGSYQSAMDSSKRLHPAFWAKDFSSEYTAYCDDLDALLKLAETSGAKVRTATPSFIPALTERGGSSVS